MESEKMLYWVTLGILAMATTTGFVTDHPGWGGRLANRSISMMSQATERVMNYADIADTVFGSGERDSVRPQPSVVAIQSEVQTRLACMHRVLALRQSEMARWQEMRVRLQIRQRTPRTIVWRNPRLSIEVPQPPELQFGPF
jgi:hypothetical protein